METTARRTGWIVMHVLALLLVLTTARYFAYAVALALVMPRAEFLPLQALGVPEFGFLDHKFSARAMKSLTENRATPIIRM